MNSIHHVIAVDRYKVFVELHGECTDRETVILVNGALATTTSFRQVTRFLRHHFNVVLYDLPYAGQSRAHNPGISTLSKEDEVVILLALIEHYAVEHVMSMSWGGVAALLAVSHRPPSVRSAAIGSFSPLMNGPMRNYVSRASELLAERRYADAAALLNNTVGQHLPRLLKMVNHRHISGLDESEFQQVHFHVKQVLELDVAAYVKQLARIEVPVLFVNGEIDEYTAVSDVRSMSQHIPHCRFAMVPGAGHFLELESRRASDIVQALVLEFLTQGARQMLEPSGQEVAELLG
ncbi:MAG: hypothetical protein RLZZ618_10 [Pseudomonadota bacterium]|jgi:pimeloyl-ACP methyl ester carboxylesterase